MYAILRVCVLQIHHQVSVEGFQKNCVSAANFFEGNIDNEYSLTIEPNC